MIAKINRVTSFHDDDTGELRVSVHWTDERGRKGVTTGKNQSEHIQALVRRAQREGVRLEGGAPSGKKIKIVKVAYRLFECLNCGFVQPIQTNHLGTCWDYCKACSWAPSFGKATFSADMFGHTYHAFKYYGVYDPDHYDAEYFRMRSRAPGTGRREP